MYAEKGEMYNIFLNKSYNIFEVEKDVQYICETKEI